MIGPLMSSETADRRPDFILQDLLARAVFRLDRRLQNSGGVFCYTGDPKCVFRISLTRLRSPAVLDGFTTIPPGAAIAELHLWNEQLPALSEYESLIAWALTLSRNLVHSLRLLSAYMAERREFDGVRAIRADMALGTTEMTERLLSLSGRYGFRPCSEPHGEANLAHRFGENILISMMMLARNASAFRLSTLRRTRVLVFMPREVLDKRFGRDCIRPRPV
jgi:hypothetical protein